MKPPLHGLSRGDAAVVAAALLIPIPLLALSGINLPLPRVVDRVLGSPATLAGEQAGRAEADAALAAEAQGSGPSLARPGEVAGADALSVDVGSGGRPTGGGSGGGDPGGGGGSPPTGDGPGGGGPDGGVPTDPNDPDAPSGTTAGAGPSASGPDVQITAGVPGATADVSVSEDGVTAAVGDGSTGTGARAGASGGAGEAGVSADVTNQNTKEVGVDATLPSAPAP